MRHIPSDPNDPNAKLYYVLEGRCLWSWRVL